MPTPTPLPNLRGRRALITGSDSGVGLEIAHRLAAAGARILMPVRNREKGERAAATIRAATPEAQIELRDLDLSSLSTVRALAAALVADEAPLDMLVLNAGIITLGDRTRHVTADGFELHFETNFLGHFALTTGLLPLLRTSRTRVAVQCSLAAAVYRVAWRDLQLERHYSALHAYGSSKVALGLFGFELARRMPELRVNICHPGIVPATGIAPALRRRVRPGVRDVVVRHVGNTPQQAALPALMALTTDASGPAFFAPSGWLQLAGAARQRRPFRRIVNAEDGRRIWEIGERLSAP